MQKQVVVTGGSGFIGAYLVRRLLDQGWKVKIIDNLFRGDNRRLDSVIDDIEIANIDIREENKVAQACKGAELVIHLAAINGTDNFYKKPDLVLDVGIKGILSIVNACKKENIHDLIVASSAEVYQTPSIIPTPEDVNLMIPNSTNPRYSYGGSKLISEIIAFNYFQDHFRKLQIFRPHNVYGPDMGWKHVIPQFIIRALQLKEKSNNNSIEFPIQGDGSETRAFCYVDDIVDGILIMYKEGNHRNIYHIGNDEEISIRDLIEYIADIMDLNFNIIPSEMPAGSTKRRCPDISKMRNLKYDPNVNLSIGLEKTFDWYSNNINLQKNNKLM